VTREYWGSDEQEFWEGPKDERYRWFFVGMNSLDIRRAEIPNTRCMSREGAEILRAQITEGRMKQWCGITIEYEQSHQQPLADKPQTQANPNETRKG
jgi:hypothetical protein